MTSGDQSDGTPSIDLSGTIYETERYEPEPQRFADAHQRGDALELADSGEPERWLQSDVVVEVRR